VGNKVVMSETLTTHTGEKISIEEAKKRGFLFSDTRIVFQESKTNQRFYTRPHPNALPNAS
jgi:hypothetical protein